MRVKHVGNLAGVKIIRGENDWQWYYLNEVSTRARPFRQRANKLAEIYNEEANDDRRQ